LAIQLKLGSIEQEHLQEMYEATGVPREDLPYSPAFSLLCQSFQDRTFKNADEGQVYHAIIKYVRSSRCAKSRGAEPDAPGERVERARMLKSQRPLVGTLRPYTSEFDAARAEFTRKGGGELSPNEFWRVVRLASERAPGKSAVSRATSPAAEHQHTAAEA